MFSYHIVTISYFKFALLTLFSEKNHLLKSFFIIIFILIELKNLQ